MKKINIAGSLLIFIIILTTACSDMNDLHDIYLREGEITYVGRVDSIKSYSGRDRALIQYWVTDPRVKKLHLLWNQKRDSVVVPVPAHNPVDSIEVIIGDGNGIIGEGDHTIFIYSHDDRGHRSIVFESLVSVYGNRYQASLVNRPVSNVELNDDNNLVLTWGGSISSDEIGILISYSDNADNIKELFIPNDTLMNPVVFDNIDATKSISYRTAFSPGEFAIDTFFTDAIEPIKVTLIENVALYKNVTVSDILNSNFPGSNAVDGIILDASRWVSSASGEHWIEIDLEQNYKISAFEIWNGTGGNVNTPIPDFIFHALVNDEWINLVEIVGNSNANFKASFSEVTTNKVRFYTETQTRLYEIAVYSIITLN